MELWQTRGSSKYKTKVYVLPRQLDEQVGRLCGDSCGGEALELRVAPCPAALIAALLVLVCLRPAHDIMEGSSWRGNGHAWRHRAFRQYSVPFAGSLVEPLSIFL